MARYEGQPGDVQVEPKTLDIERISESDDEQEPEEFDQAVAFLPQIIAKNSVSNDDLLYLYARYKQVTVGPCNTKRPGFLEFQAKKKWDAWNLVKEISEGEAKSQYIQKIKQLEPGWDCNASSKQSTKTRTGWVSVSSMPANSDVLPDDQKTVYDWCRDGDLSAIQKFLDRSRNDIDSLDEQGMSLLHWACDRGCTDIVRLLLDCNADVNVSDADGQTPLHYACACGHAEIVQLLLENNVDARKKDNDGETAAELVDDEAVRSLLTVWMSRNKREETA